MVRANGSGGCSDASAVLTATQISEIQANPFYIRPSESPTSVIILQLHTGSNYNVWTRSMKRALFLMNKYQFVDGRSLF